MELHSLDYHNNCFRSFNYNFGERMNTSGYFGLCGAFFSLIYLFKVWQDYWLSLPIIIIAIISFFFADYLEKRGL